MKKSTILVVALLFFTMNIFAVNSKPISKELTAKEKMYTATNLEEFLELTPRKIRKQTGKKLKLKEIIVLKAAQKRIKKAYKKQQNEGKPKSQVVALIFAIAIGYLGVHRFYLGYTGIGIVQILTLGGCGIWALIDLIMIATGDLKPRDGSDYDPTL